MHASDCRERCRANSSLQVDLTEFQGECDSALTSNSGYLVQWKEPNNKWRDIISVGCVHTCVATEEKLGIKTSSDPKE